MQGYVCHLQGEVLEEIQHHYPLDLLMALSDAAVGAMQASVLWSDEALMLSPGLPLRAIVIILDAPMLQGLYMRSKRYLLSSLSKARRARSAMAVSPGHLSGVRLFSFTIKYELNNLCCGHVHEAGYLPSRILWTAFQEHMCRIGS